MSISRKLTLIAIISVFLAFSLFLVTCNSQLKRSIFEQAEERMRGTTKLFLTYQQQRVSSLMAVTATLAASPQIKVLLSTPNVDQDTLFFTAKEAQQIAHSDFAILTDQRGHALVSTDKAVTAHQDMHNEAMVQAIIRSGRAADTWILGQQFFDVVGQRVVVGEVTVGTLILGYAITEDAIAMAESTTNTVVLLTDGTHTATSSSLDGDEHQEMHQRSKFEQATREDHDLRLLLSEHAPIQRMISRQIDRKRYLTAYSPIIDASREVVGVYVLYGSLERPLKVVRNLRDMLILSSVICLCLVVILMNRLVRSKIVAPLEQVIKALVRLGDGQLGAEPLSVDSRDEIGQLRDVYNRLLLSQQQLAAQAIAVATGDLNSAILKKTIPGDLGEAFASMSQQLRVLVQEIKGAIKRVTQVSTLVSEASIQMSEGAQAQGQQVEKAFDSVADLTGAIQEISSNASFTTDLAQKNVTAATTGNEMVAEALQGLGVIQSNVSNISVGVDQLGQNSDRIEKIIQHISGIANESNMLALNASIEAARAGEQGKGFSVVADEVQKLSERSHGNAQEITKIVHTIQNIIQKTIESMKSGSDSVSQGLQTAGQLEIALKNISEISKASETSVKQVVLAVEQQGNSSQTIVAHLQDIVGIAKNADGASKQLLDQTNELKLMVAQLENSVNRFSL